MCCDPDGATFVKNQARARRPNRLAESRARVVHCSTSRPDPSYAAACPAPTSENSRSTFLRTCCTRSSTKRLAWIDRCPGLSSKVGNELAPRSRRFRRAMMIRSLSLIRARSRFRPSSSGSPRVSRRPSGEALDDAEERALWSWFAVVCLEDFAPALRGAAIATTSTDAIGSRSEKHLCPRPDLASSAHGSRGVVA